MAIRRAVILYTSAAHAFGAGIKGGHCIGPRHPLPHVFFISLKVISTVSGHFSNYCTKRVGRPGILHDLPPIFIGMDVTADH